MTKHTKGPWTVNLDSANKINIIVPWSDNVKPEETATFGDIGKSYF